MAPTWAGPGLLSSTSDIGKVTEKVPLVIETIVK